MSKTGRSPFKKLTPKRALFTSPNKTSPDNKRRRIAEDNERQSKIVRSVSMVESNKKPETLPRTRSDAMLNYNTNELSELHKQKLQWAVYEALKTQKIGASHPQYKTFACNLARVTRRFLPNLSANAPRPEGGTSERMLRIARQHVFAVTRGKSVDEIVQNFMENKSKIQPKPTGYVGLDDDKNIKDKENIFRDNSQMNKLSNSSKTINNSNVLKKVENKIDRVRKVINFDAEKR